ncbi:MAG TPA: 4a-hydroxytetrahydrobiopterin dehydratase [Holophagaceae bacterium]|nr:4a-hydroxytetrahydrobiopterin dehydratase [Holophagaceae bacterium]
MSKAQDRQILSPGELEAFLAGHPAWVALGEPDGLVLRRRYPFASYTAGLGFVVAAAEHAEAVDHHPDLMLGWRVVVASLTTHVSKGVSRMDLELAEALDRLYPEHL